MTRQSPDTLLERRLEESFAAAHDDPRWAGDGWTDPVGRLRKAGRAHRRRVAVASGLSVAAIAGGAAAAVSAIPASNDRVGVTAPMAHGQSGTGLDWLLTRSQYDAYTAAHPSPSPATDRVPSPAPVDDELRSLQADIAAALPNGVETVRADAADGGARGDATVWLRLADGTPVAVERYRLDYPRVLATDTDPATTETVAAEQFSDPQTWSDGSAYTTITGQGWGYAFGRGTEWSGPFVWTVTPDGWFTSWTAPVTTEKLLGWAQAADEIGRAHV